MLTAVRPVIFSCACVFFPLLKWQLTSFPGARYFSYQKWCGRQRSPGGPGVAPKTTKKRHTGKVCRTGKRHTGGQAKTYAEPIFLPVCRVVLVVFLKETDTQETEHTGKKRPPCGLSLGLWCLFFLARQLFLCAALGAFLGPHQIPLGIACDPG